MRPDMAVRFATPSAAHGAAVTYSGALARGVGLRAHSRGRARAHTNIHTLGGLSKKAIEYTSILGMTEDLLKRRRMAKDPTDRCTGP